MKKITSLIAICLLCFSMILVFSQQTKAASPPPVGHWEFDEGLGSIASDSSGYGNTGTLLNGPQWVEGKYGSALYFDGIDDFVQVPDSESLTISGHGISIEFWMYPAITLDGDSHPINFVGKGLEYVIQFEHDDQGKLIYGGQMSFAIALQPSETNWKVVRTTTNRWNANTWYHIAGTYDGNYLKIYVNGKLENSQAQSGDLFAQGIDSLGIGSHFLGDWPPEPWSHHFNGTIDEVKIYNYARVYSPPTIVLTPSTGFAAATVVGSRFSDNSRVSITWDETVIPTVPCSLFTDANGNFTAIISVPNQNTPGTHTVNATDQIGNWATATFDVVDMTEAQGARAGELQFLVNGLTVAVSFIAVCLATIALFRKRP